MEEVKAVWPLGMLACAHCGGQWVVTGGVNWGGRESGMGPSDTDFLSENRTCLGIYSASVV